MKRAITVFLSAALLAGVLCGCSIRSPEELYALPKLPEEFNDLQEKINEVTAPGGIYQGGAELTSPSSGTNTQNVQLRDLNGDGVPEAIAFFRVSSDEKPLKIYIFRQGADGYEVSTVIEGEGTAIEGVYYENLNEGASQEILVSWQLSASVHNLAVYALHGDQAEKLMEAPGYTRYRLVDIDRDNLREILVVQMNTVEGANRVECWQSEGENLILASSAPMSQFVTSMVTSPQQPQQGFLQGELTVPALLITANFSEGYITDIFAWKDDELVNVTLDEESQYSVATFRQEADMAPRDINGDGLIEVPMPVVFTAPDGAGSGDRFYNWRQFDIDGNAQAIYTTYHNDRDKDQWYFILPDAWEGKIGVTVRDSTSSGERQVIFSYRSGAVNEDGEPEEAVPFLTLYKLTGTGRQTRAKLGNRFVLANVDNIIYAAEFAEDGWDCGLDQENILEHFKLVTASYSSES